MILNIQRKGRSYLLARKDGKTEICLCVSDSVSSEPLRILTVYDCRSELVDNEDMEDMSCLSTGDFIDDINEDILLYRRGGWHERGINYWLRYIEERGYI